MEIESFRKITVYDLGNKMELERQKDIVEVMIVKMTISTALSVAITSRMLYIHIHVRARTHTHARTHAHTHTHYVKCECPPQKTGANQATHNRNRKLLISRAPTKAKSQEPAYSQALNQNKIDRQRSRSRESGRQTVRHK